MATTEDSGASSSGSERLLVVKINGKFPDYYGLLGVPRAATKKEIVTAYRQKARDEHPDKQGGTAKANERFAHINNARGALATTEDLRKQYDRQLLEAEAAAARDFARNNWGSFYGGRPAPPRPPRSKTTVKPGEWREFMGRRYFVPDPNAPRRPTRTQGLFGSQGWNPPPQGEYRMPEHPPFGKFIWPAVDHQEPGWDVPLDDAIYNHLAALTASCASMCDVAVRLEEEMIRFDAYCHSRIPYPSRRSRLGVQYDMVVHGEREMCDRFHSAKSLLWEIMKFVGCGFQVWKGRLERLKSMSYDSATATLGHSESALDKIERVMSRMLTAIQK